MTRPKPRSGISIMTRPTRVISTLAALLALATVVAPRSARSQGGPLGNVHVAGPAVANEVILKRMPADRDGLTFRGESASRSFAVFMTRQEADKIGEFRLTLVNAISVLPERSSLRLSINGRQLTTVPIHSAGRASPVSIRIPPGVVVPGFNSVSIAATLAHRVDCSVKATYELWTSIDPAETGFVLPAAAAFSGRSVADVGDEPLAPDGTTHIHVRLPDHADAEAVERASRLVARLVADARILRPLVDVGPDAGTGPGLDVVSRPAGAEAGTPETGRVLLRGADVTLLRDPASRRLTVAGQSDDLAAAAPSEPAGDPTALGILRRSSGQWIEGAQRITFEDLGFPDESFPGRHYLRDIRLRLPADFYPGSYDKARILLDGGYAGELDAQSALVFRVNGALVSTLKLRSASPGRLQHELVELPLQFFHPGSNDIAIEGTLTAPADVACNPAVGPEAARLMIGGSSEIEFPYLAHLATMPQIAGALSARSSDAEGRHDVYLLNDGADSIGNALTVAANLAANGDDVRALRLHLAPPGAGDRPGLVLGPTGELPVQLRRAVDRLTQLRQSSPVGDGESGPPRASAPTWRDRFDTLFRQRGFFFAAAPDSVRRLAIDDRSLLVASVRPNEDDLNIAGVDLPRFTEDGRQWLVFTARTTGAMTAGLERLVADGMWPRLNGEAASFGIDDGKFTSLDAAKLTYVLPRTVRVADLRPIMGGLMSSNIALTASATILLLALLGLTMHGLLRMDRRRPK